MHMVCDDIDLGNTFMVNLTNYIDNNRCLDCWFASKFVLVNSCVLMGHDFNSEYNSAGTVSSTTRVSMLTKSSIY